MAKRQNFVVGSTNPNTQSRTTAQLNNAWNQFEVLRSGVLDGVFNAISDYSNDSSNEIANAIVEITGSQPTGESQTELAGALRQMREDIETTSLTFKGYISATQPSASDYDFQVGNIWIQSATLPTSFPVAIAGIWNGTQWESTTETYTQKDFDFFRNVNDNEGYYWFGGEWTVMSTDMSTTYFSLNQTSGKWEIKDSVNLPGAPTVATPTSASPETQIANKKYVDENISTIVSEADLFDIKWRDAKTTNPKWILSDGNWKNNVNAYNHLADDLGTPTTYYGWTVNGEEVYTSSRTPQNGDSVYVDLNNLSDVGWLDSYNSGDDSIFFVYGSRSYTASYVSSQTEYSNATRKTETIAGTTITYYEASDGHKIILPAEETNADAIYAATGVAWYYVLDTVNQQFKLPRTKFGFTGIRSAVGGYVEAGLPNFSGSATLMPDLGFESASGDVTISNSYSLDTSANRYGSFNHTINIDLSKASSIYGNSNTVQPPATQMYLYFYVGSVVS